MALRQRVFRKLKTKFELFMAFILLLSQFAFIPLSAIPVQAAAGDITVSNHQAQLKDANTGTLLGYTTGSGNVTTYAELDSINFRFTVDSSVAASGQMAIRFTGEETTGQACTFFQQTFSLGTHDGSADPVELVSGTAPAVTTVGVPTQEGDEWVQVLDVDFTSDGESVINYYLTLTDEAGDCGGSSQHSRLSNGPEPGDFANIGAENVPVPAKDIIELATIIATKYIDDDGDGQADRTANAGEWSFSLDGGSFVDTDANGQVIFSNLETGTYTVTEEDKDGYDFLGVSGDDCVVSTTPLSGEATVEAAPTADDASCDFTNSLEQGAITITKNSIPDSTQDFDFTSTVPQYESFTLDDESGADTDGVPESITISGVTSGEYTFTENETNGWYLDDISCTGVTEQTNLETRSVTFTVEPGDEIECTFTNRQLGQIIVTKQTQPDEANNDTGFDIEATTVDGEIIGNAQQTIHDDENITYTVKHGTYDVEETVPAGWEEISNTCSDLVINGNTPLLQGVPTVTCTIINGQLAKLKIVKDSLPNHAQDFTFTTTGDGLSGFTLDDDADATLMNSEQFSNLTPGEYSVTEGAVNGWELTGITCVGKDGQVDLENGKLTITLAYGDGVTCTFENTKYGFISGFKYEVNADGSDATGLDGWTIQLLDATGGLLGETITDGTGYYSFDSLLPGDYEVQEVTESGYTQIVTQANNCSPETHEIDLSAGEESTNNNFCNFENASISGFKWNDKDGDGVKDNLEPKLANWTVFIDEDGDKVLDAGEVSAVTDVDGNYSFTDLIPGTYDVCEVQQTGWMQTHPSSDSCHELVIDESGEDEEANFGNQGRVKITVNKDVDHDGDGQVDEPDASDWTWDYSGQDSANDVSTGTTENVAAGTYSISEDQQTNYHFVSVICTLNDQELIVAQAETITGLQLAAGDDLECTFTNARDLGQLKIIKDVINDDGGEKTYADFTFKIDDGSAQNFDADAGDADGFDGMKTVDLTIGTYDVTEPEANTMGYATTYDNCDEVEVKSNETAVCTITNDDIAPTLTVVKKVVNDNGGTAVVGDFNLKIDDSALSFDAGNMVGDTTTYTATPDVDANTDYELSEFDVFGYDEGSWTCDDGTNGTGLIVTVNLDEGEDVICEITNDDEQGSLELIKRVVNDDGGDEVQDAWTLKADGPTAVSGTDSTADKNTGFTTPVDAGTYDLSEENGPDGYELTGIECGPDVDNLNPVVNNQVEVGNGEELVCVFTNDDIAPTLTLVKKTWTVDQDPDQVFHLGAEQDSNTVDEFDIDNHSSNTYEDRDVVDGSDGLKAGEVTVFEDVPEGWEIFSIVCVEEGGRFPIGVSFWQDSEDIELDPGDEVTCYFTNKEQGDIAVLKYWDINQNQERDVDEELLPGWTFNLDEYKLWNWDNIGTTQAETDENGLAEFNNLSPFGKFILSEELQDGWLQGNIECEYTNSKDLSYSFGDSIKLLTVPGVDIVCEFGNFQDAELFIDKTNDTTVAVLPGATVTYTITVTNPDTSGVIYDAAISDLLPDGITYVDGSYSVISNQDRDITGSVIEPDYNSDGNPNNVANWNVGDIAVGEVLTLTYKATVGDDVDPGTYTNIAWVNGEACQMVENDKENTDQAAVRTQDWVEEENTCPGANNFLDKLVGEDISEEGDPFVESDVTVGSVLGEAERFVLAVTGTPAILPVVVGLAIASIGGATLVSRRKWRGLVAKLTGVAQAALVLAVMLVALMPGRAMAATGANWQIDMTDLPDNVSQSTLDIGYQAVSIDAGDDFSVRLLQNGTEIDTATIATEHGGSGEFIVNGLADGTYTFTVEITNSSDPTPKDLDEVVTVDTDQPDPVVYEGVERNGNTYTLNFSAPGADTIQIFASTSQSFETSQENLVGEVDGSATTFEYTAPDSQQRYFALVAVDDAGNRSAVVGDTGTAVTDGVNGSDDGVVSDSAATDDQTADDTEGEEQAATDESDSEEGDGDDNSGLVVTIIVLAGLGALLYNYFVRNPNQSSN